MNAPFTQGTRPGRLATRLGEDVLVLLRFSGAESINTLFEFRVEALSSTRDLDFDDLIGTHATVEIDHFDDDAHFFDGIVTQARWAGVGQNGFRYDLELRPWFWLAGRRRNQRIWHEKTVIEILTELFAEYTGLGAPAFRFDLAEDYPVLEYTVQFKESDLDFACRMMERFGISYFFEHAAGSHTLVVFDRASALDFVPGTERAFFDMQQMHKMEGEHFWDWHPERNLTTGAIRLTDYNFKTPHAKMVTARGSDAAYQQGQIESYDWPGRYLERGRGEENETALRVDQERGQDRRHYATGNAMSLRAGTRVKLTGDVPVPDATGQNFACLATTHAYQANNYGSIQDLDSSPGVEYSATHVLTPATAPIAPRRKTPLARVYGPHTAMVVGEGEIDCDEYGRILVRFHWDLEDAYSMRCRVSQNWSGNGWGGMIIPRIGMEVVVEFLDGDPDKPLVTGCVYNGKTARPYPLPAHKTKSVFRTDTHTSTGFNEVSFEDQVGEENIALHAQKDQTLKVLNNRMKRVDNDQIESVGENKSIEIGNNHQEKIGGSMNLTIGGGKIGFLGLIGGLGGVLGAGADEMIKGAEEVSNPILSSLTAGLVGTSLAGEAATSPGVQSFASAGRNREVAGADQIEKGTQLGQLVGKVMPVSGIMNTVIEKAKSDTIGLARTEQIGLLKNTVVGQVQTTTVGKTQRTKVGETQTTVVGKHKKTVVGEEYVIEVGKSKLVMKSDGTVLLTGVRFNFEAEGPVQVVGKVIDLN